VLAEIHMEAKGPRLMQKLGSVRYLPNNTGTEADITIGRHGAIREVAVAGLRDGARPFDETSPDEARRFWCGDPAYEYF
jgi:hypothetical protein